MARPKGTKYIETPEKMWELFESYRNKVKENPRIVYEFVGRDGNEVQKKLERPLTLEGFENYVAEIGVISDLGHYFANTDDRYTDYCTICSRIKKTIRQDQIEGGMVGQYNPSITQRLNNLVDRQQHDIKEQPLFGDDE
jgi:endonuclease IV